MICFFLQFKLKLSIKIIYDSWNLDLLASELNSKDVNATRNAKKLFHSCVNENLIQADGERKFLKVLQYDLQGWPILNQVSLNDTISNQTTATSIVQKMVLLRKYGFRTLIDVHVTLNPKDPQTLILKVLFHLEMGVF